MKRVHGIYILEEELEFPDPCLATPEGIVAVGGDFSSERILLAYQNGIFPWTEDPITWWSPNPRAIIPLESFHISRRLERTIRQGKFSVTFDRAFEKVIHGCASPHKDDDETWITEGFIEAYCRLHAEGYAHSVECWYGDVLAGGVYGVAVGGLFAGESMFHSQTNGSSIALAILLRSLRGQGFELFDTQMITNHTAKFGAIEIPREDYLLRLRNALCKSCKFPEIKS